MSRTAPQKKDAASEPLVLRRRKVRHIPNAITQAVGKNLRHFRQQSGMTQLELAMKGEVERTRVSKLELGLVNPSVLTLATLCHVREPLNTPTFHQQVNKRPLQTRMV